MKRFVRETCAVMAALVLVGWYRLTRQPLRVAEVWAELEAQLCGETNEECMARRMRGQHE